MAHGVARVVFEVDDAAALAEVGASRRESSASVGETLLEVAERCGIDIEHACGGVCACSTCHVYVEGGMEHLSEADEAEEDRLDEAADPRTTSRLSCQARVLGVGTVRVRVPGWNRNAVKESPH